MINSNRHYHDFQIVLQEVLGDGTLRIHQECDCGAGRYQDTTSGIWKTI